VTPLGSLEGHYWEGRATDDGRLLLRGNSPLALVDPATGSAAKIGEQLDIGPLAGDGEETGAGGDWLFEMLTEGIGAYMGYENFAVRGRYLAVAAMTTESSRVDVYRLPPVSAVRF
jgi:hypothetical protein